MAVQKFVSPMEAKAWIKAYPRRVTSAYGFLIIGIASQLRPMQHAMLVLGCQPYAPDFVRLCTVLLDGRSPGGRTLPCLELH